jgi:arylsulfatase A-like enzyme
VRGSVKSRAALAGLLLLSPCLFACGARPRPNVVLFVVDTLRADAIGAYGSRAAPTPNVNRLASEGVLFERAYSAAPWTRASMAALLSGIDPDALGAEGRDSSLPTEVPLLAELFREAGYRTAGFAANPNVGSFYGFSRGFETYGELYERRRRGLVGARELVATADEVVDRAIAWLAGAEEPFFLFVFPIDPHGPYRPPPSFDRYAGRASLGPELAALHGHYLGEVAFTDHAFGRLLSFLDERELSGHTLVAFTSDHGEEFEEHGERGHGHSLYEEEIRVPLVMRLPGAIAAGSRVATPVPAVDVAPTLLSLAGVRVPDGLDGRARAGSAAAVPGPVYASLDLGGLSGKALVEPPWKLVLGARTGGRALFQLDDDPGESRDRADRDPERLARLAAELAARSSRNVERRRELGVGDAVPRSALPRDARDALEALGYLDAPDEASGGENPERSR